MASIQKRSTKSGDAYRVQFRDAGRMRSRTFWDASEAADFQQLVERLGPDAALRVLAAREGTSRTAVTVLEHARAYVARIPGIEPGTRRDYERMLDRRLDGTTLGRLPLAAVTRDDVVAWTESLDGAVKTRRNYHALVSAALADAVDRGLLASNPARKVAIGRTVREHDMVILTAGEFAVLLGEMPTQYQPLVAFLAGTGLRLGEATALTVGDVDLDAAPAVVRVRRAWKRTGTGERRVGPPKTDAGVRTVSLPPQLVGVLEPLVAGRRADATLFVNGRGKPIRGNNLHDNAWQPALKRLNESGRMTKKPRVHDLRHLHASQLLAAGVPLHIVQQRLGHEKIETTVSVYTHLLPDALQVAATAAGLALVQALPELEG